MTEEMVLVRSQTDRPLVNVLAGIPLYASCLAADDLDDTVICVGVRSTPWVMTVFRGSVAQSTRLMQCRTRPRISHTQSDDESCNVATYSAFRGTDLNLEGHAQPICSLTSVFPACSPVCAILCCKLVAFLPAVNSELIASGSMDGTIRLWCRGTGECKAVICGHGLTLPLSLAMTESWLLSGDRCGSSLLWYEHSSCV